MAKIKKLDKNQRDKLRIVLAWYNLAWSLSDKRHEGEAKRIADEAIKMFEEIVL